MKNLIIGICSLILIASCTKDNSIEPISTPLKKIIATGTNGNYTVEITHDTNGNILTYTPSNGLSSFKFTYNANNLPSIVEEKNGGVTTEYTISYKEGRFVDWSSSRILNGSVWVDGPDYEYTLTRGRITEISQFIKGTNTKTGSVTAEYGRQFVTKITSTMPGNVFTKTYTYNDKGSLNIPAEIELLTPNMPAHLVSLFVAEKETNDTNITTFSFEY